MDLQRSVKSIQLIGTVPQVKWAKTIRDKKAKQLQSFGIRTILLGIKPHITEDDLQEMGCTSKKNILSMAHGICIYSLSCKKASWWITNREQSPAEWLKQATEVCVGHWKKAKPFNESV